MTTKEWLYRARNLNQQINQLIEQQDAIRAKCMSITPSYGGEIVTSTKDPHSKLDSLFSLDDKINKKVDELIAVKREIMQAIRRVENATYRKLLTRYYVQCKTWEQVAEDFRNEGNRLSVDYLCKCLNGRAKTAIHYILCFSK